MPEKQEDLPLYKTGKKKEALAIGKQLPLLQ